MGDHRGFSGRDRHKVIHIFKNTNLAVVGRCRKARVEEACQEASLIGGCSRGGATPIFKSINDGGLSEGSASRKRDPR